MKKLTIHETMIESEKGSYFLSFFLISFAILVLCKILPVNPALGSFCILYAVAILILNIIKVREIVINEETVDFISRVNKKSIKIRELTEIKPIQAQKLRFITYSNIVTVSYAFTGMSDLIVMLRAKNPDAKISGI